MAYSTLQPDMRYFDHAALGYLAYMTHGGTRFVLGDPVCSYDNAEGIIRAALAEHPRTVFVQASQRVAQVLQNAFAFFVNGLGIENVIEHAQFTISWKERRDLKRWLSALAKTRLDVISPQRPQDTEGVQSLSLKWIEQQKTKRELAFLARPLSSVSESECRRFLTYHDGALVAVCSFDPCYCGGQVQCYALNHLRALSSAPDGTIDFTIVHAIRTFAVEGLPLTNLGLSPLHCRSNAGFRASPVTDAIVRLLYRFASPIYNFRGVGFHKDRYKAHLTPQTYLASPKWWTLPDILRLLRVNRVL